jgi:hypothetical protein
MEVDGATVEITPQDVEVKLAARDGWTLASEGGYVVALSTTLTELLQLEGRARELVRQYNDLRKTAGFRVEDLMNATWTGTDGWQPVFEQFADYIRAETLAANLERTDAVPEGATTGTLTLDGSAVVVSVRPAVGNMTDVRAFQAEPATPRKPPARPKATVKPTRNKAPAAHKGRAVAKPAAISKEAANRKAATKSKAKAKQKPALKPAPAKPKARPGAAQPKKSPAKRTSSAKTTYKKATGKKITQRPATSRRGRK